MKSIKRHGSIILLVLVLTSCQKNDMYKFSSNQDISNILLLETNTTKDDLCMVTSWEDRFYAYGIIPSRYLVLKEMKGKAGRVDIQGERLFNMIYHTYNVNVYSVETKECIKTYTLNQMEEALPEGYKLYRDFGIRTFRNNGQDYLLFSAVLYQKRPDKMYERKCFVINVETDEMKLLPWVSDVTEVIENSQRAKDYDKELDIFLGWTTEPDKRRFMTANGFHLLIYDEDMELPKKKIFCRVGGYTLGYQNQGIAEVEIATDSLPKENRELYTKFPGLKEYQGQEGLIAIILLNDFPTAEEILRLILEEGQEISFEGCVMDGTYSKDGQTHEIGSFEEFYEWYDPEHS